MAIASMDRRALLQRALLVVGAAVAPGGAKALAQAVASGTRQLDTGHYELLTAVADTIIPTTATPGAVEAGVPQIVDALLGSWASPSRRVELTAALDAIDRLAQQQKQKGFSALSAGEREAVLTPHDAAALKPAPLSAEQQQGLNMMERLSPHFVDPGYGKLKELIVVVFYYSQTALTHDLAYEHVPGEWQPSIPITPGTRPWGGVVGGI